MGHVKRELQQDGKGTHELDYISFSDVAFVERQQKNRSKQHKENDFNEQVQTILISLDELIEHCGLTETQKHVADLVMLGYTYADVAEHYGVEQDIVRSIMRSVCRKICAQNRKSWLCVQNEKLK